MKIRAIILLLLSCASLLSQTFEIANCEYAFLRTGPGVDFPHPWKIQKGVNGILLIGPPVFNGPTKWQKINSRGLIGWVNANFLVATPVAVVQSTPIPVSVPQPTPPLPPIAEASPTPESIPDCLVVATEMYARLKPTAYWTRICAFRFHENGEYKYSHAFVFFQPVLTSNVFFYEKALGGSIDTHTKSHDLTEIISAINQRLNNTGITLEQARWIDE